MYRQRFKGSQKFNERMARWREAKERIRLEGLRPIYPYEPPEIRRRIIKPVRLVECIGVNPQGIYQSNNKGI